MRSDERVVAVVAAHGTLATGLVSAVDAITGAGGRFLPVSNSDLALDQLEARIAECVAVHAVRIIVTDLPAGSCTIAALRVARATPGVRVVTGASLPVLLHLAGHADDRGVEGTAVERAQAALRLLPEEARAG